MFRLRALGWLALLVLLAPALLLTGVRLLDVEVGWLVRLESFTPWAIALYAVALAALLLVVLLRRGRRRPVLLLAGLVALGLALHAWWFAPMVTGSAPAPAADTEPLTVMSANMRRGEGDGIQLVAAASNERVDVLVVQEITPRLLQEMEAAGLSSLMPYRAGQPGASSVGTMAFAREEITGVERLRTGLGSWAFTVAGMRVFGVHPAYPLELQSWQRDHAALREAVREQEPDLVVGDFNATADHEPMQRLQEAGYRDAAELTNAGWQPTWPTNGGFSVLGVALPTAVAIDHVLVGPRMTALETRTLVIDDADHAALVARVARR